MTLAQELARTHIRIRSRRRVVRPMGAWEIATDDPQIHREEMARIRWTKQNAERRAA